MGRKRVRPLRFPAIDRTIKAMGGIKQFCENRYFPVGTYYSMQAGTHEPTLPIVMEVLDYTGLSFEEAFLNKPAKKEEPEDPVLREKKIPARGASTQPGKTRKELP